MLIVEPGPIIDERDRIIEVDVTENDCVTVSVHDDRAEGEIPIVVLQLDSGGAKELVERLVFALESIGKKYEAEIKDVLPEKIVELCRGFGLSQETPEKTVRLVAEKIVWQAIDEYVSGKYVSAAIERIQIDGLKVKATVYFGIGLGREGKDINIDLEFEIQ